jgi:hypothetical protein
MPEEFNIHLYVVNPEVNGGEVIAFEVPHREEYYMLASILKNPPQDAHRFTLCFPNEAKLLAWKAQATERFLYEKVENLQEEIEKYIEEHGGMDDDDDD